MGTSIPSTPLNDVANASIGSASGAGILGAIGSMGTSLLFQAGVSILLGTAASLFRRKPRPRRGRDLLRNLVDPTTFLPVVYGSQRVTGLRTFVTTTGVGGSDRRFLWVACALSHGPVAGIDEIYLDGYLAVNAAGNAAFNATARQDFSQYVTAWKGYGTEGGIMYHPRTNARTITGTSRKNANERYIDFSAAHSYLVGDTLYISGTSGVSDGAYFVSEATAGTRIAIGYPLGGVLTSFTGLSGACDYYMPDLPTDTAGGWTSIMQGKGVAFILLRLVYDETRFPNGLPDIEANVRGIVMKDTRAPATGTITTSAISGTGVPRHASAALITESGAHGLAAGDTVYITGHTPAELNGTHRIFDVPSPTTYRLPVALSAGGTGGTRAKLAFSTTPALCIREFLTNHVYGAAATDAEIDDTGFGVEATYHETATDLPIVNSAGVTNLRGCSQIVVSGGVATATTTTLPDETRRVPQVTPHTFLVGQTAWISGFSDVAGGALNGKFLITVVPTASTFRFATAVANGTYFCDVRSNVQTKPNREDVVTIPVGKVSAITPGTLFTTNGIADPSQAVQQTLEELLSSCRGLLVYQSGLFRLTTPRATTPLATFALTDDTIIGEVRLILPGQADMANVLTATFPNAAASYQQDTISYPSSYDTNTLLGFDNNQWLRKEIELPFTSQRATAQQICMVLRQESRARILQCVATEKALLAQVGDVVPVTREVYGFSARPFRILIMAPREDDTVEMTLVEHDDSWYNLDPSDDVLYYDGTPPTPHFPPIENFFLRDFRKQGASGTAGPSSLDNGLTLGYQASSAILGQIDVSAHTVRVPTADSDYVDVSYNSGTVTLTGSGVRGVPLYVYVDDATYAGGALSYAFSVNAPDLMIGSGRRWLGTITVPAGIQPPTIVLTAPRSYKEVA